LIFFSIFSTIKVLIGASKRPLFGAIWRQEEESPDFSKMAADNVRQE